jgi:hypothetical protein
MRLVVFVQNDQSHIALIVALHFVTNVHANVKKQHQK